jgi:hypothetical protein
VPTLPDIPSKFRFLSGAEFGLSRGMSRCWDSLCGRVPTIKIGKTVYVIERIDDTARRRHDQARCQSVRQPADKPATIQAIETNYCGCRMRSRAFRFQRQTDRRRRWVATVEDDPKPRAPGKLAKNRR